MTPGQLLEALAAAGLEPVWDGGVKLRGDPQTLTAELRKWLRFHREWLESSLKPNTPPRETEFRWSETGLVDTRWRPGLGRPLPDQWRYVGEGDDDWRPMPTR